jgi:hypothetical protein
MLTGLDVWLRRQREGRGWSKPEMARRLAEAMKAAGDPAVPPVRAIYRSSAPHPRPTPPLRR